MSITSRNLREPETDVHALTLPVGCRFLTIQGQETEASERARDSTANAYSSYYSTKGLRPSKRGTREVLTLSMKVNTALGKSRNSVCFCLILLYQQVQGSGEVSTRLQVKLYKQRDITHCEWGSKLHCIELDCSNYGANIIKETYRKIGIDY